MFCNACESNPCACHARRALVHGGSASDSHWIIQHCSEPGCEVAIRMAVGQHDASPICKWHQDGTAREVRSHDLAGMPDVECPWPWQTDDERERRLRMPSNQQRFKRHAALYTRWILSRDPAEPASVTA